MQGKSVSGRRMLCEDGKRGAEYEYSEEAGLTPVEKNEDGEETG
jgi:hypothetical protein